MSVIRELRTLYERDGDLTPEQVLEAAGNPRSSLHARFTWDDTEAARRWRLNQARALIMKCRITVIGSEEQIHRVRAFVNLPAEDGPGTYAAVDDALADPSKRDVVLRQALRDLAALRRKYRALIDFDAVLRSALLDDEQAVS